jgi:hypothetical protein
MVLRGALALLPALVWQGYIAHVKGGPEYMQLSYEYQRAGYQFYNVGYLENLLYVDSFVPELGKISSQFLAKRIVGNLASLTVSSGAMVSIDPDWIRSRLQRFNKGLKHFDTEQVPLWLAEVPFAVLGLFVFFGLILLTRRGGWLIVFYAAGLAALACLTPWPRQFIRYLWPLTPILAIALFMALIAVRDRFSMAALKCGRTAAIAFITTVVVCVFSLELIALGKIHENSERTFHKTGIGHRQEYRLFFYTPAWQFHDAALDWLAEKASPDEVVATSTPHWLFLKTGLRSVMPPFEANAGEAQRLIDSVPVSYLIIDTLEFIDITKRYAVPIVETFPEHWELIYSSPKGGSRIYQRVTSK